MPVAVAIAWKLRIWVWFVNGIDLRYWMAGFMSVENDVAHRWELERAEFIVGRWCGLPRTVVSE